MNKWDKAYQRALETMPVCLAESFDSHIHTTIEDLIAMASHEIDLYNEGQECLPRVEIRKVRTWRNKLMTMESK